MISILSFIERAYARAPLSWFVTVVEFIPNRITTASRRREATELREIANLADGVIDPKLVRELRDLADRMSPGGTA